MPCLWEQTPVSMTFPKLQRTELTAVNQGREGMQRQGRNNQETIVQPWGMVLDRLTVYM